MDKQIIEQMRKELYARRWCQKDFEYDVKNLSDYNGPFIWHVRECGTSLSLLGMSVFLDYMKKENLRFSLYYNKNTPIMGVRFKQYNTPETKYFYYDGFELKRIQYGDIERIYNNLWGESIDKLIEQHQDEYKAANSPLRVEFASKQTEEEFQKQLKYAESIGDESLKKCLERLTKHSRYALNQYIHISSDFSDRSFCWSEIVNGTTRIYGGIIFHSDKIENRWQIHT